MPTVAELSTTLEQKRGELAQLFAKHKNDKGEYTADQGVIDEINRRNDELTTLGKSWDQARAMASAEEANAKAMELAGKPHLPAPLPGAGGPNDQPQGWKSLGQRVAEAKEYNAALPGRRRFMVDIDQVSLKEFTDGAESKALMTTTAGWAPFIPRIPRVVLSAQRRPVVADLVPQDDTTASSIKFMEETTFTNNAATVAQGGTKPESALVFTERTQTIEKIATVLPVTEEQLDDVPQLRAVVDNRLTLMLQLAEENQLVNGDGNTPNLQGFLTKTGIQTQARGTDPTPDAIYKAIVLVQFTGFADATGVIINPTDWQNIRLLRTADGLYIWGSPADAGPERIWGLPIVRTPVIAQGTALTGDFQMYSQIWRRMGMRIDVSDQHSTFFAENKLLIRLEERLNLVVYRGAAFAKITGMPAGG
jgi:HK97 family phage major capsid protein